VAYPIESFFWDFLPEKGVFSDIGSDESCRYSEEQNRMPCLKSLIPNLYSGATRSLRDFDLRLGGCEICASDIYFSNCLENNEGKILK
jgi:hypothetical protein